ncbi:MAG: hypothetical protein R2877_04725 [Bdellovibrionota bacterium]
MQKDEIEGSKERRKDENRAAVEIMVDLSAVGATTSPKSSIYPPRGAFICHDQIQPIGTIHISFKLPNHDPAIETEAVVAWSYREGGSGKGSGICKFTQLKPEDQKIETYIKELLLLKPKKKR